MRINRLIIFLLILSAQPNAFAQISHGGVPYFPENHFLRSFGNKLFFNEMPSFDLDSVLQASEPDNSVLRGSYQFAHKFYTKIRKKENAALTLLPDGTKVWQIGIRSKGAYSINLLLKDFEIPEGGKLFVYSSDYSHIIGSFDHRNNSPEKILPLQPVAGESIILEYSEPENVAFEGNFTIAEVNHDYRDFLRREPGTDTNDFLCMPDAICSDATEETIRSTVLLIINGTSACTGSLINNTEDDGKPYLLTAVHCFNANLPLSENMDYYIGKAGTVIAFFNYHRSVCGIKMRGVEEMSLAVAYPRVILEKKDIALLELQDTPPDYYNAYYAGWNVNPDGGNAPYTNLHHPATAPKKYGKIASAISLVDYPDPDCFDGMSHWEIPSWTIGSTHPGSSGSPLFDRNNLIIGGLSGGESDCIGKNPDNESDYFFALSKGWESSNPSNQLKTYLDPENKELKQYPGFDPNKEDSLKRLGNANYNSGDSLITSTLNPPYSGFIFGNSNLQALEFAEEFKINKETDVIGSYFLLPYMPYSYISGIEISIYSGGTAPETKLQSKMFYPQYLNYNKDSNQFEEKNRDLYYVATESFVLFDNPAKVNENFFISYKINYSETAKFCVYNTKFANNSHPNTAWIKTDAGWVSADNYSQFGKKTALAIHALVRDNNTLSISSPDPKENPVYYDRAARTLFFRKAESNPTLINVYSVTGQLLEKTQLNAGQLSCILSPKPQGTMGIIKAIYPNKSISIKIIY
jgi:hypothetical protein